MPSSATARSSSTLWTAACTWCTGSSAVTARNGRTSTGRRSGASSRPGLDVAVRRLAWAGRRLDACKAVRRARGRAESCRRPPLRGCRRCGNRPARRTGVPTPAARHAIPGHHHVRRPLPRAGALVGRRGPLLALTFVRHWSRDGKCLVKHSSAGAPLDTGYLGGRLVAAPAAVNPACCAADAAESCRYVQAVRASRYVRRPRVVQGDLPRRCHHD